MHRPQTILIAEDDAEDRLFFEEAWEDFRLADNLRFVADGQEMMDYLKRRGKYESPASSPRPGLILLDLRMPHKNGWETLEEIKSDPDLRGIPVVVMSWSKADVDVRQSYDRGASSHIAKPETFEEQVQLLGSLSKYWLETVELPPPEIGG